MGASRCPHFVRHGRVEVKAGRRELVYRDRCGLKMRHNEHVPCHYHPFETAACYTGCEIYRQAFQPSVVKNDAVPTKDLQYAETMPTESITEMKLL